MSQTTKNWTTTIGGTFITVLAVYAAQNQPGTESWAAWKPILIAALCAAILSAYHSYQPQSGNASGSSSGPSGPTATAPVTPEAKKDPVTAEADKLSRGWLWGSSVSLTAGFALLVGASVGCHESPAAVQAQVVDLTNAICALAPDSPVGGPVVEIVCSVVQPIEQAVSVVIGAVEDGGVFAASATIKTDRTVYHFPLPASVAPAFLAAHSGKSAPSVAADAGVVPAAKVNR